MRHPALPPIDERTLAEALAVAWSRHLDGPDLTETDLADFADWLLASPHHGAAWDRLERLNLTLRRLRADLSRHPDQ